MSRSPLLDHSLDARTLYWVSGYLYRTADIAPLTALRDIAALLGDAAHRIECGEAHGIGDPVAAPGGPPEGGDAGMPPGVVDGLISQLRALRAAATPGEWFISELDGAWVASTSSPLMEAIARSISKVSGGPDHTIGECAFSWPDESYALAAVNAVPVLIAEIERLRKLVK